MLMHTFCMLARRLLRGGATATLAYVLAGIAAESAVAQSPEANSALQPLPTTSEADPRPLSFAPPEYPGVLTGGEIPHPAAVIPADPLPPVGSQLNEPAADLAERLKQAEARIKQLETQHKAAAAQDAQQAKLLDSFKDRWDKARDPSITTVDQQTYDAKAKKPSEKKWYDRLSIRGYAQLRISEILDTETGSAPAQYVLDRSIGDDQSFLMRRARLIVSGDVSDHMYVYLQSEFAQSPDGATNNTHFAQIRDWYADWYLDDCKVHRLRFGQSKVPYGWETLQSSSNRLPLERSDAINTAVRNERDLGIFYYWTPQPAQDFFKFVLDKGLKGSGNYGVFGMGFYNGQGGSFLEQNDDIHFASRLTLPYQFAGGQCMEVGIQGYIGEYGVFGSAISPLGVGAAVTPAGTLNSGTVVREIRDQRIAGSFIWYPQPIGFQAEWNVGRGPGLTDDQTLVEDRHLYGGYVQTMYKYDTRCWGTLFPYARWVSYHGGYKAERNAPFTSIEELEVGTEWQVSPQLEFTMAYMPTDRTNTTAISTANTLSYRHFYGSVLRFQVQFNY
jgi:hypothetical protein